MLCRAFEGRVGGCMDRALADNGVEGTRRDQGVDGILERLQPVRADDLIPLLQQIQDEYGHLPVDVLHDVSERTGIPTSRMYGVITFYSLFHVEKRGRHTVRACRGTACHVRGGQGVIQAAQKYLGLADGETGEDLMFSFETAACLGACALSPVVVTDGVYSGKVTPERVEQMLRSIAAAESAG